ncbi:hypothetical protein CC2G_005788 [Coprinopsis cinerea AmutBmut pab1-1]|nr:hypothetical protein CC2G_005788 [Coprinopsis cinerea AmutBmut pab1-1]
MPLFKIQTGSLCSLFARKPPLTYARTQELFQPQAVRTQGLYKREGQCFFTRASKARTRTPPPAPQVIQGGLALLTVISVELSLHKLG